MNNPKGKPDFQPRDMVRLRGVHPLSGAPWLKQGILSRFTVDAPYTVLLVLPADEFVSGWKVILAECPSCLPIDSAWFEKI